MWKKDWTKKLHGGHECLLQKKEWRHGWSSYKLQNVAVLARENRIIEHSLNIQLQSVVNVSRLKTQRLECHVRSICVYDSRTIDKTI